jgi:CheY-like chemotaxis protein
VRKLITYMMEDPRTISPSLDLVFLAKAIERIGDHAKNIAEFIIYVVKGTDVRHTPMDRPSSPVCAEMRTPTPRPDRRGRAGDCRADRRQPAPQRLPADLGAEDGVAGQRELDAVLPDVILLDWMLPGQSGWRWPQMARRRRAPRPCPSSCSPRAATSPTRSPGWTPAPTTTSPSPFPRRNCWRASAPCCAAARPSRSTTA